MALEVGLRTLLLAQSSITALVPAQTIGGTSYPRVFVSNPKQGIDRPYILIKKPKVKPNVCLDGTMAVANYTVAIECCADEEDDAMAIAAAANTFLKDYSGAAGSHSIKAVIWQDNSLEYTQEAQGRDVQIHKDTLTYLIQAE